MTTHRPPRTTRPSQEMSMLLGEMSWPTFQTQARESYAIVPVGAVEPHGPHLPLAADTMISEYFAGRLAPELGGFLAPSISYGVATPPQRLGGDFPGVINLRGSTFTSLVTDVLTALARCGVRRYVVVNSAIDNMAFLCESARILTDTAPDTHIMIVNWWDVVGEPFRNDLARETGVDRSDDHHAAMVESSLVMHIAPDTTQPGPAASTASRAPRRLPYHVFPLPPDAATPTGVVYTAARASAEIGRRIADQVARELAAAVRLEFDGPHGQ